MSKSIIKSVKDVETFLFCEEVRKHQPKLTKELMSKAEIKELSEGIKVLNLEEDEDVSHHLAVKNSYRDIYRSDEEERFKN
jgi:hypothetical protein